MKKPLPPFWQLLLAIASAVTVLCFRTQAGDQPQVIDTSRLCYAFLRHGKLWTSCEGRRYQVDLQHKIVDFAVTADGSTLVALVEKQLSHRNRAFPPETEIMLVRLRDGLAPEIRQNTSGYGNLALYSSCGTIISRSITRDPSKSPYPWPQLLPGMHDIIADQHLTIAKLVSFRCSSDRRVVAGWETTGIAAQTELLVMSQQEEQRKLRIDLMNDNFDVSPSGRYIAFSLVQGGDFHICITEPPAPPVCSFKPTGHPGADYKVSVSDSEQVIYMGDLVEGCGSSPCIGVAYWNRSLAEPLMLERNAGSAQWINPDVAAYLHRLANSSKPHGH